MKIAGLVLHTTAAAQLDAILSDPSHALLLAGPVGIGKTHIARALGVALLGLPPTQLENQPYYREVVPVKGAIGIEQVRDLTTFFKLTVPGDARIKRVAVLQDAEAMGREAQNALLKLLEEPPAGSVLILTSSQPEQLLPTIRSRTQIVMLAAPEQSRLTAFFTEQGHAPDAVTRTLLRTGSNVAAATNLLAATGQADASLELVKKVLGGTAYDKMLLVDGLAKQKEQAGQFVATLAATAVASLQAAAEKNPTAIPRWQNILGAAHTADTALASNGNAKLVLTELMLAL